MIIIIFATVELLRVRQWFLPIGFGISEINADKAATRRTVTTPVLDRLNATITLKPVFKVI